MKFPRLKAESDQLLHLDLLRFVAASAIVFHHSSQLMFGVAVPALAYSVDVFFLISGFVIAHVYSERVGSWAGYGAFIWRRLARLMPLHLITVALAAALYGIAELLTVPVNTYPDFSFGCTAATVLLVHPMVGCETWLNYPNWSISAEMIVYLAFPLLIPLRRYAVSAGLMAGLMIAPFYDSWLHVPGALRALPSFLIGIGLFSYKFRPLPAPTWVRRLAPLGQLTYAIYMIHWAVFAALLSGLGMKTLHLAPFGMIVLGFTCYAIIFGLSYLSYFWLETPARRWLNGLGDNDGPARQRHLA